MFLAACPKSHGKIGETGGNVEEYEEDIVIEALKIIIAGNGHIIMREEWEND